MLGCGTERLEPLGVALAGELTDHRMQDGSRQFAVLPECFPFAGLRDHVAQLDGAVVTGWVEDGVREMWLDFTYCGRAFAVNNQMGEFWFFVKDPACPDAILRAIVDHCERLVGG